MNITLETRKDEIKKYFINSNKNLRLVSAFYEPDFELSENVLEKDDALLNKINDKNPNLIKLLEEQNLIKAFFELEKSEIDEILDKNLGINDIKDFIEKKVNNIIEFYKKKEIDYLQCRRNKLEKEIDCLQNQENKLEKEIDCLQNQENKDYDLINIIFNNLKNGLNPLNTTQRSTLLALPVESLLALRKIDNLGNVLYELNATQRSTLLALPVESLLALRKIDNLGNVLYELNTTQRSTLLDLPVETLKNPEEIKRALGVNFDIKLKEEKVNTNLDLSGEATVQNSGLANNMQSLNL